MQPGAGIRKGFEQRQARRSGAPLGRDEGRTVMAQPFGYVGDDGGFAQMKPSRPATSQRGGCRSSWWRVVRQTGSPAAFWAASLRVVALSAATGSW